ncbi:sensor histidine kinase [Sediminitomix flava]|nr:histidine kinase [Sediminitomix flava]
MYTKRSFLFRWIASGLIAVIHVLSVREMNGHTNPVEGLDKWILLELMVVYGLFSEGNVFIDHMLDKKMPWFNHWKKRPFKQFLLSYIWCHSLFIFYIFLFRKEELWENRMVDGSAQYFTIVLDTISGVFLVLFFNSALFVRKSILHIQKATSEIETLKQEKLKADYQSLQDQLNPHFLFNSLNVLISEIYEDQDKAVQFTQHLSDVYRYVLQSSKKMTVSVSSEMKFIEKFAYLQKTRLGEGLQICCKLDKELLECQIPPLSIQVLIENAIKHNVVSEKEPLLIDIKTKGDRLYVINNLQPKTSTYSTETGLKNIFGRYEIISDRKVIIEKTEQEYIVSIPLLDKED